MSASHLVWSFCQTQQGRRRGKEWVMAKMSRTLGVLMKILVVFFLTNVLFVFRTISLDFICSDV